MRSDTLEHGPRTCAKSSELEAQRQMAAQAGLGELL
jgi:hypothetical protein